MSAIGVPGEEPLRQRVGCADVGLAVGLMSGTSADGIDAALVEMRERPGLPPAMRLRRFRFEPFTPEERASILALNRGRATVPEAAAWHAALGERFGWAVRALLADAGVAPGDVCVVGSHGQTVAHAPHGTRYAQGQAFTVQLGDPARIAEIAGAPVVSDFRARDLALGGEGAPLVPAFDRAVFGSAEETRVLLNIGGIANVTVLARGGTDADVIAFDTGPGNMVLDAAVEMLTDGRATFDADGALAARGIVQETLLTRWKRHPFFAERPPKSTGREVFGFRYTQARIAEARALGVSDADLMATLTALVADTIADAIRAVVREPLALITSGGGAKNRTLMARIGERLTLLRPWETSDAYGVPSDAKEAMAFAYLAWEFIHGRPGNVPSATGARAPARLGSWTPAPLEAAAAPTDGPAATALGDGGARASQVHGEGDRDAVRIRVAGVEDIPGMAEVLATQPLWQGVSRATWERRIAGMLRDGHIAFVIPDPEVPGRLNAVLIACDHTFGNCGYVRILGVRAGRTSHGMGARLMAHAHSYFRSLERKAVLLLCTDTNHAAQAFYERLGYRRVGALPDWLEAGRDEWLYVLRLDGGPQAAPKAAPKADVPKHDPQDLGGA